MIFGYIIKIFKEKHGSEKKKSGGNASSKNVTKMRKRVVFMKKKEILEKGDVVGCRALIT